MKRRHDGRSGASLVFAIVAVATLVSLTLGVASVARSRLRLVEAVGTRAELRVHARNALCEALAALAAQTNEVTHLGQDWARDSATAAAKLSYRRKGTFVIVEDELSLLSFPECGERALAALISLRTGLSMSEAAGLSRAVFAAADAADAAGAAEVSGSTPDADTASGVRDFSAQPAERILDFAQGPEALAALSAVVPIVSSHAGGKINPNTVTREAFCAALAGVGADPGAVQSLWARLERARERGDRFESATPAEALKLLRGEGDEPSAAELSALRLLAPALMPNSQVFRVRAVARGDGSESACSCVWRRGNGSFFGGTILEWRER